jgi:hypothetical protein
MFSPKPLLSPVGKIVAHTAYRTADLLSWVAAKWDWLGVKILADFQSVAIAHRQTKP